jgi:hypothetical protein
MALPRKDGIPVPGWKEATNEVQTVDATLEALVTTLNTKIDTIDALLDAIIAGTTPATVQLYGSKVCLSSEAKPAGEQGDTLLEYDEITGETKVYKYISGDWREL